MPTTTSPTNERIEVTLGPEEGNKDFKSFEEVQTWFFPGVWFEIGNGKAFTGGGAYVAWKTT